jgi:hypothetical protein
MGFPFMMWGGGDGSSDINRNGGQAGGVQTGTAVGTGAGILEENGLSHDERLDAPEGGDYQDYREPSDEYGQGDDPGLVEGEDVMQDPWGKSEGQEGLFGGSASGDAGGDWGDWGDWS